MAVVLLLVGCNGIPADPYLGTINANNWDPLYGGGSFSAYYGSCLAPRSGYQGQMSSAGSPAGTKVLWYYVGNFSVTQLDITNYTDPNKTPPQEAYQIDGCTPYQSSSDPYNVQTSDSDYLNYQTNVQYPIFASGISEPTSRTTYKPWYYVTPVGLNDTSFGCNNIRNEQTIWNNGGWNPLLMSYGSSAPSAPLQVGQPTIASISAGMVPFKDWPLYNLAEPIDRSEPTPSFQPCPFGPLVKGQSPPTAPQDPADTKSDFFFPAESWLRGLLNGYLDGGDVPLYTSFAECLNLFSTGQPCMVDTDCKVGGCYGAGTGTTGTCVATSAQLDTGVACSAATCPGASCACTSSQTCSAFSSRCVQTASLVSTGVSCSTTTCDAGAGEVCMTAKNGQKTCAKAPWPVCPQVNDLYVPMDEAPALLSGSVSVVEGGKMVNADQLVVFSNVRGDQAFSPVCRLRYYDPTQIDTLTCTTDEMENGASTGRPLCTAAELLPAVVYQNEMSFVNCVFPWQQ